MAAMPDRLFREWCAYLNTSPPAAARVDATAAQIVMAIYQTNARPQEAQRMKLSDFMIDYKKPWLERVPQSPEMQDALLRSWAERNGAK